MYDSKASSATVQATQIRGVYDQVQVVKFKLRLIFE